MRISDLQDGETNGVGIGPASSNIVTELILQAIDQQLMEDKFEFTRYVDDYHCYAATKEQAEAFVYALNDALYEYRLTLNHRKTEIVDIESTKLDSWLHEIRMLTIDADDNDLTMIRKLRGLQQLARDCPSVSILKYGLKTLEHVTPKMESGTFQSIVPEIARMMWVSPFLTAKSVKQVLPYLDPDSEGASIFVQSLKGVLKESVRRKQADVTMWSLYGLSQLDQIPAQDDLIEYTRWNPVCMALGLSLFPSILTNKAIESSKQIDSAVRQIVEEQWLLRYQVWLLGGLKDAELNKDSEYRYFPILRDHGVDFFQPIRNQSEANS